MKMGNRPKSVSVRDSSGRQGGRRPAAVQRVGDRQEAPRSATDAGG